MGWWCGRLDDTCRLRYIAKLSKIDDSTRYILGKDSDGEYRYYTEIKLSFEIQGDACLNYINNYNFAYDSSNQTFSFNTTEDFIESDLNTPLEFECKLQPVEEIDDPNFSIMLTAKIPQKIENNTVKTWHSYKLFEGVFSNLSFDTFGGYPLNLRYLSDSGLLLIKTGNGEDQLVTLQSTTASGKHLIERLEVNKFKLPGVLESGISEYCFQNIIFELKTSPNWSLDSKESTFQVCARTNVI